MSKLSINSTLANNVCLQNHNNNYPQNNSLGSRRPPSPTSSLKPQQSTLPASASRLSPKDHRPQPIPPRSAKQRRASSNLTTSAALSSPSGPSFFRSHSSGFSSPSSVSNKADIPPNFDIIHQWSADDLPEDLAAYISTLSKTSVNRRDIFGRTLLHLVASTRDEKSTTKITLAEALLANPHIDASLADYESGWTPLHYALASGNMEIAQMILARSPETAAIRDKCDQRPLDLFRSMMFRKSSFTKIPKSLNSFIDSDELFSQQEKPASMLLAYGSNTNHNLGFPDGDDKAAPQQVPIVRDLSLSRHIFTHYKMHYSSVMDRFLNDTGDALNGDESDSDVDSGTELDAHAQIKKRNKQNSKLLKIPMDSPTAKFLPLKVTSAKISKYHSAVLSADHVGNLFLTGSTRCGRLGLASEDSPGMNKVPSTQFTFCQVPFFSNKTVVDVALGHFHTVVLTSEGLVYSFGSNEYGQLGYPTPIHPISQYPEQHSPQLVPEAMLSSGERIIGVAASKVHSVAYSQNYMLMWGKNVGQMGFTPLETSYDMGKLNLKNRRRRSSANVGNGGQANVGHSTSLLASGIDPKDGGIIQSTPRVYTGISGPIVQVVAGEFATVYLLEDHSVWVLMNGENFRIKFPSFTKNQNYSFSTYNSPAPTVSFIDKISISCMGYVCAIDSLGIVYSFNLRPHYTSPAIMESMDEGSYDGSQTHPLKGHQIAKNIKVKILWIPSTTSQIVIDADISDDGSVILSTREGIVWKSFSNKTSKLSNSKQYQASSTNTITMTPGIGGTRYVYEQVFLANRVYRVTCDALFSSFLMLHDEYIPDALGVNYSLSKIEYAHLLPRIEAGDTYPLNEYFSSILPKQNFNTMFPKVSFEDNPKAAAGAHYRTFFTNERSPFLSSLIGKNYLYMSFPGDSIRPYFPNHIERHFDVDVYLADGSGLKKLGNAHSLFLLARLPFFKPLLASDKSRVSLQTTESDIKVVFEKFPHGNHHLTFSGVKAATVESIISYIYTDDFFFGRDRLPSPPFLKNDFEQKNGDNDEELFDKEDIRLEIYRICKLLGIMKGGHGSMSIIFNSNIEKQSTLGKDLFSVLDDSYLHKPESTQNDSHITFTSGADVDITLEGDVHVYLHSYVLAARSPFFAASFSQRWYNDSDSFTSSAFKCYFPDMSLPVFQVIITYIYCDFGVEIFNNLKGGSFQDSSEFVKFIKRVWQCANFLTLVRLCDICQAVLKEFVHLDNVCETLEFCLEYDGFKLQAACLQYIFENIEFMFENGLLSDLSFSGFYYLTKYCKVRLGIPNTSNGSRLFRFINDIETHNEVVSSLSLLDYSPFEYSKSSAKQAKDKDHGVKTGVKSHKLSTDDGSDMLFSLDMEENNSSNRSSTVSSRRVSFSTGAEGPSATSGSTVGSSGWKVVGSRKPSFSASSRAAASEAFSSQPESVLVPASKHKWANNQPSQVPLLPKSSSPVTGPIGHQQHKQQSAGIILDQPAGTKETNFPSLGSWQTKEKRTTTNPAIDTINTRTASAISGFSKPSKLQQALHQNGSTASSCSASPATLTLEGGAPGVYSSGSLSSASSSSLSLSNITPKISTRISSSNSGQFVSEGMFTIKPAKMSKKDRKKLEQKQKLEEEQDRKAAVESLSNSSMLPEEAPASNPWKITNSSTAPVTSVETPFSIYSSTSVGTNAVNAGHKHARANLVTSASGSAGSSSQAISLVPKPELGNITKYPARNVSANNSSNTPRPGPMATGPTLADIIEQERIFTEIKVQQSRKSFKEIQEEEEFAKWWAEESARVQREEKDRESRQLNALKEAASSSEYKNGKNAANGSAKGNSGVNSGKNRNRRNKKATTVAAPPNDVSRQDTGSNDLNSAKSQRGHHNQHTNNNKGNTGGGVNSGGDIRNKTGNGNGSKESTNSEVNRLETMDKKAGPSSSNNNKLNKKSGHHHPRRDAGTHKNKGKSLAPQ